ncbi:hypothetical protein [Nitrosomonas ureae]|uniref:Uncharacterized protein n=1 Tax=Nitrosomonas ureae TaxID=44577 RepID=A0A1H9HHP8_9PROT|nr:hypothetical protein [Nitrosomonas ureae]SEQ61772.1 hypothetical protein SAMN05421510_11103 [Nitrosomonas ureae]
MTYSTFSLTRSLPSLLVTKDFLLSLERYLMKWGSDTMKLTDEELNKAIDIDIEDKMGVESFTSINQMNAHNFTDSTSIITIKFNSPYRADGTRLRISLDFSKNRIFSTLVITATMPNSRVVIQGILSGILEEIERQRTWHWIVNPPAAITSFLVIGLVITTYLLFSHESSHLSLLFVHIVLYLYIFLLPYLRPYIYFDSRVSKRKDELWDWFIKGIASFLLFGTLLTFIRDYLI